ncbi:adenylate/guanylate cyclase domain-containing protein [Gordonia sp. HY285]|uniref:adenylate/guanylate cyclase domain-containing protein n=1 Tax=Gordonia liuliyuniae TaxID=2911517 RepID=UPI001F18D582|nr:adenylate/guanylate cyclase domain-containing protein [Gordonia liuliyuniae]MCF8609700.1 adenylate/guanylate cyclase domain-containing protein [Gordonia liuliyuniae]
MARRNRAVAHRIADWIEARLGAAAGIGFREGGLPLLDTEILDAPTRRGLARRGMFIGGVIVAGAKILIGVETFVAVLLAFNGGQLNLHIDSDYPLLMGAVLIALLLGTLTSVLASFVFLTPQFRWFVDVGPSEPADERRRGDIRAIPRRLVCADLSGWAVALGVYALISDTRIVFLLSVAGAFGLAAVTSSCLTYLFAESAARPLAALALRGGSVDGVMHGVRERMVVVWIVSSAVPMVGLILMNVGRGLGWVPQVAGDIDWATMLLAVIALTSGARVVGLVNRAITDPLNDMREVVEATRSGDLTRRVAAYDASELGVLQAGLNAMLDGLVERERMRDIFSRHVGDGVAQLALEQDGEFVGGNTEVAVIFVDITGSTAFAADRDPRETAVVLNAFFSIVVDVVDRHGGFINKFEGDAALIVFGAPAAVDDPAAAALAAARELGTELSEKLPLEWGMGVTFGSVFAGNIGARTRYEYTVIGDAVNESARLSDLAKLGYSPVYASRVAIDAAAEHEGQRWKRVDRQVLRGRTNVTEIHAPIGLLSRPEPPSLGSVLADLVKFAFPGERPSNHRRVTE